MLFAIHCDGRYLCAANYNSHRFSDWCNSSFIPNCFWFQIEVHCKNGWKPHKTSL